MIKAAFHEELLLLCLYLSLRYEKEAAAKLFKYYNIQIFAAKIKN